MHGLLAKNICKLYFKQEKSYQHIKTSQYFLRPLYVKFRSFRDSHGAKEIRGRSQWRRIGSKLSRGESVCQWSQIRINLLRSRILFRIRIEGKTRIRIRINIT